MQVLTLTYSDRQKEFCVPNAWLEWFCEPVFDWNGLQEQVSLNSMEELGFFEVFFENLQKIVIRE